MKCFLVLVISGSKQEHECFELFNPVEVLKAYFKGLPVFGVAGLPFLKLRLKLKITFLHFQRIIPC